MRRHAKASSAGSNSGQARSLGSFLRGAFATRGAADDAAGSGAPAHRTARPQTLALLCLAVAAAMALTAAPALAVSTHPYTGTSFGPDGAAGSETFTSVQGVAVDQISGNVYVFDAATGKVYKFDSAGEPADFSALAGNVIEGVGGSGRGENEIAIAPPGAPGGTAGNIYVANIAGIQVYAPSGAKLGEFAVGIGEVCGVATDPAGHVFAGIYPSEVKEYTPTTNPPTDASQTGVSSAELPTICGVAADGLGNVYATSYFDGGEGVVKLEGLSDPVATLISPAKTIAVDPSSNDLYADRGDLVAQYDSAGNLLGTFGAEQLSGSYGVAVNGGSGKAYVGTGDSGQVAIFGAAIVVPGVSTGAATEITGITADLNGSVNPDNLAVSDCKFEYGTTTAYGSSKPCAGAIPTDGNDHPVSAALNALNPGTTYHFRIVATNANGVNKGSDETFTTKQPSVTGEATEVKGTKATLNGTVFPEGEAVSECLFEYGAGLAYGKTAPCVGAIPTDNGEHAVTAALTHLTPNTPVHFRLVINRNSVPIRGVDKSFNTEVTVVTGAASTIAPPTAGVEGTLNPEGILYTACSFEYGLTSSYGSSVPCTESPASIGEGTSPVAVHANLSGLNFGATYHYRLSGTNVDGTSRGADQSFNTPGAAIEAAWTDSVGLTEAILKARINPKGSATTYRIEYGTDTSYGTSTPETPIGAENVGQTVTETLSTLTPATTYHWRVVATNSVGESKGQDRSFTTYVPSPAPQTDCPNQVFRTGLSAVLPDCRAYEQATPVDKNGANVQGDTNFVQASAAGNRVTFADAAGLPTTGGSSSPPVYLASRGTGAWSSNGLLPLTAPGDRAEVLGWDDEIASAASSPGSGGVFLANTATNTFQLAASTPRSPFPNLAGFADDTSHLILESARPFTPGAIVGSQNLFDLDHGSFSLVGRIPPAPATVCDDAGAPACIPAPAGSFAGSYEIVNSNTALGGASRQYYTQNTISDDGSKVFFTAAGSGQLYVREDGTATTQVSASQASTPDPNGHKPAAFLAATPSGSKVFFASCEKLTDDSTAVSSAADTCTGASQGQDLYSYDTASGELTDLTVDANVSDAQRAGVIGAAGISADGTDVYFVANGVLAPGASQGNCGIAGFASTLGTCNLYLSRAGITIFIARLDANTADLNIWTPRHDIGLSKSKESRVSADGTLLFGSPQNLTGYDNTLASPSADCTASAGNRCLELYRYSPIGGALTCISCNPTGALPTGSASLENHRFVEGGPHTAFLTRNISPDGNRAFFDSPDPLVPADTNGVIDPYEWEAEGTGSCHSADVNGGCLYLLSSGTSTEPSYLGDVSASGDDAFFFTGQPLLVPADTDELVDVYDARVGGGLASQHPSGAPACLGEACKGASTSAPNDSTAGSASFNGPGNQAKKPVKRCKKQSQKKCKKSKKQKKKSKSKQSRGAHTNRGGSK